MTKRFWGIAAAAVMSFSLLTDTTALAAGKLYSEQSAPTHGVKADEEGMKEFWRDLSVFINENHIHAYLYPEGDKEVVYLYDHRTSAADAQALEEFIRVRKADPSLVLIKAKALDPLIEETACIINKFLEENELSFAAHAEIYDNCLEKVFVVISDRNEEKAITSKIKAFMSEQSIGENTVDIIMWDTTDENGVRRGDINDDGRISYKDLDMLEELISAYPGVSLPDAADFDGDGVFGSNDVQALHDYIYKLAQIDPDVLFNYEYGYLHSCFSELSVKGSTAVCKSLTYCYYNVDKLIVEQTLQRKNEYGRWVNVKTWKGSFRDYKAAVNNKASGLPKGFYRLKAVSVVYEGNNNETVEKYSRKYALGISPDTGDANGDRRVNVRDCAYIAKMLAHGRTLSGKADFNLDGKRNVRDAAALANDLAGN